MKKHNFVFLIIICFIFLFTVWSGFTSCKSIPTGNNVDPLNLLDDKSDFYISIPKEADPQLIERIISKNVLGISKKDLKRITERTSKVYCGISDLSIGSSVQAAIEANIPLSFIPSLLTEKKGWNIRESYSIEKSVFSDNVNSLFEGDSTTNLINNKYPVYKIYNSNNIDISFPDSNIVCIGRDVNSMLNRFNYLAYSDLHNNSLDFNINNSQLSDDLYLYLKGAEDEIRFYSSDPKKFLINLTGKELDLKLIDIQGSFKISENYENSYLLNMDLNFKEHKFLKAGRALLRMALGLSGSNVVILSDNKLVIKDLLIGKEQLNKVLGL